MRSVIEMPNPTRSFTRDQRGNVGIIFGAALLPLTFFCGAAVDYSRALHAKTILQAAADAAVTAAVNTPGTTTQKYQAAANVFNANAQAHDNTATNVPTLTPVVDTNSQPTGDYTITTQTKWGTATTVISINSAGVTVTPSVDVPTEIPPPGTTEFLPGPTGDPLPGPVLTALPGGLPGAGHTPVDARFVDEPPALLVHPELRYPEVLRQAGIEGRVLVEAVLDTLGRAEAGSLRVTESPNALFDREALTVVAASRYRPGRVDGRAVRVRIQVPVAFAIRR